MGDELDACTTATSRCLAAIAATDGEGARVFTQVYAHSALLDAAAADRRRASGRALSPIDGRVIAVKDLFDVLGHTTWAGSLVRRDAPPASADAQVVSRLRRAGAVIIGKTNMTEFAYSGIGLNPHYGTPANPFGRAMRRRIPGGSSSGAAVAVADGMAEMGLGTDTGGSVRIPAALCGLVGWKPTARRISLDGVWPLAPSLDSVGVIAKTVRSCAEADAVLTAPPAAAAVLQPHLRLARLRGYIEDDMEPTVRRAYEQALLRLAAADVELVDVAVPALERVPREHPGVVIAGREAFDVHQALLDRSADLYDPRVRSRLELGRNITLERYTAAQATRHAVQQLAAQALEPFDAWLLPTVTRVAAPFSAVESDDDYLEVNRALLRNTSLINFLDGCAISLPCQERDEPPVGLSIAALSGRDSHALAVAQRLEPFVTAPV
ncbi:MAG TPA: amidase [Steroidobacteraceae bacterium]